MSELERKPSQPEDEYFAREEIEKKRALSLEQARKTAAAERERLKALHFMKCPKCGMDLHTLKEGQVELESCFNCHGVWLDSGELEQLVRQAGQPQHKVIDAVLNLFKRK